MPLPIITTTAQRDLAKLWNETQEAATRARQAESDRRITILEGDWRQLVYSYMRGPASDRPNDPTALYSSAEIRQAVAARVKRTPNLLIALADIACVAYKRPPVRRLKGASQASQDAFKRVVEQSRMAVRGKSIERWVWACNVVITMPVVRHDQSGRGKRLDIDVLFPHFTEVATSKRDPMGAPVMSESTFRDGSDYSDAPTVRVRIDDREWTYFDEKGIRRERVVHGAGVYPGTPWRSRETIDDWWDSERGAGLVDATIEVAHLQARMDWVRQGQDRRAKVLNHDATVKIPAQAIDADGALELPGRKGAADFSVVDMETRIDGAMDHIVYHSREAARLMGIPPDLLDFKPGGDLVGAGQRADQQQRLAEIRDSAIEYHRDSERDMWWRAALVMRGMGHPDAKHLQPDEVLEKFEIEYAPLTFAEEPKKHLEILEMKLDLGLTSTIKAYQELYPGITDEEARAAIIAIAEQEAEVNDIYVKRNVPRRQRDRTGNIAELQGRIGGLSRSTNPNDEDTQDDERNARPGRGDARTGADASRRPRPASGRKPKR